MASVVWCSLFLALSILCRKFPAGNSINTDAAQLHERTIDNRPVHGFLMQMALVQDSRPQSFEFPATLVNEYRAKSN